MKFKIFAFILLLTCKIAHAKLIFDDQKLRNSFNEGKISEIFEITTSFKNIIKRPTTEELKLYKKIYLIAIYKYMQAQDFKKIYKTTNDIFESNIFNEDKKFMENIAIQASITMDSYSNCEENSKFILENIRNGSLSNKRTNFFSSFVTKNFITTTLKSYERDSACLSDFFSEFLNIEYKNITTNKNYNSINARKITKHLLIKTKEAEHDPEKIKNFALISVFAKNLLNHKGTEEFISFLYEINHLIPSHLFESILTESEDAILNLSKNTDDLLLSKITLIAKYLGGEQWPFKKLKSDVLKELLAHKNNDKKFDDLYLVMTSKQALAATRSNDKILANKIYRRILEIDTKQTAASFEENLKHYVELQITSFKISASLSQGDLKNANEIYNRNINNYYEYFNSPTIENVINRGLSKDQITSLLKPILEFEIELGRKEKAKEVIDIALKTNDINIAQIRDFEYLTRNKKKFQGQFDTLLYLLRYYYEYTSESEKIDEINLAISLLVPDSYNESINYFPKLFNAIFSEDIEAAEFHLEVFKDNIRNFSEEFSYFIYLDIYDALNTAINAYPGESATHESLLAWKKNLLERTYDDLGLMFFIENSKLGYFNKISILEALLSVSSVLEKNDAYYVYSSIYLEILAEGVNSTGNQELSKSFTDSKISKIEEIINFYIQNDYLIEARNAISIFKQQSFFEHLGSQGSKMRGIDPLSTDRNQFITSKIKSLTIQIALVNKQLGNESKSDRITQLVQLKSKLMSEIELNLKTTPNASSSKELAFQIKVINESHAYADFFFKNDALNIIYQDESGITKFSNPIDSKSFSSAVLAIYSNHSKNSGTESTDATNFLFQTLFEPIQGKLISSKIKNLHIRSNSFITSIPIKYLISTKKELPLDINVIYQGIHNAQSFKFLLDSRSSLFATTQKHGNFPALTSADSEVNYIYETYKSRFISKNEAKKFVNKDFSIEKFSSEFSSQASVIHIASHYSPKKDTGGLLLGTGQMITPKEIWSRLSPTKTSKLVTISACESGLFNEQGQSIEDLPNVFLDKGANFVIATLWKISDAATADFMRLFYDLLMLTGDPAMALNSTQASFAIGDFSNLCNTFSLNDDFKRKHLPTLRKYSSPYFWAGFQIISSN